MADGHDLRPQIQILVQAEGLLAVHGAHSGDFGLLLRACHAAEYNDVDVRESGRLLDGLKNGETIVFGQMQVQQNDAGVRPVQAISMLPDELQRLLSGFQNGQHVFLSLSIQRETEEIYIRSIIVDYKDSAGTHGFAPYAETSVFYRRYKAAKNYFVRGAIRLPILMWVLQHKSGA
jgi:hypothetical protein